MISITVGLIVMAGVLGIFVNTVKASSDAMKMTRLNQELRAAMDVMTRDIRRAGYWGKASTSIGFGPAVSNVNPFDVIAPGATDGVANSCIIYSYDEDKDGVVDEHEYFGFRLKSSAVQSREENENCTASEEWKDITDKQSILITALKFEFTNPKTVAVNPGGASKIKVREVTITLQGELKNDSSVKREIKDAVRVRSDQWTAS